MNIRLLGTGAADGIPSMWGDSEVNRYAREHGGKDFRTRSAALIDEGLKIDLPPDTHAQCALNRVDPKLWTAVVFTHTHADHFAPDELQYALFPFTDDEFPSFTVYGNAEVVRRIKAQYCCWPYELVQTASFQPFQHLGYTITPIRANHKLDEDSQNLIVQKDGKTFLYGTDTGIWHDETWDFLEAFSLDGLVIEATDGFFPKAYYGHLSIDKCLEVVNRLRALKIVHSGTQIFTTHHAHLGGATHAQLESVLKPHGIEPGYDGLEIKL